MRKFPESLWPSGLNSSVPAQELPTSAVNLLIRHRFGALAHLRRRLHLFMWGGVPLLSYLLDLESEIETKGGVLVGNGLPLPMQLKCFKHS